MLWQPLSETLSQLHWHFIVPWENVRATRSQTGGVKLFFALDVGYVWYFGSYPASSVFAKCGFRLEILVSAQFQHQSMVVASLFV